MRFVNDPPTNIVLRVFNRIFHGERREEDVDSFLQFVKFGLIGVSNTIISYVVYVTALFVSDSLSGRFHNAAFFMPPQFDYLAAQVIAFILSVLWSFYWNNKIVFTGGREGRCLWKALVKTFATYSFTGLFLNSMLLALWVEVLGISKYIAPFLNSLFNVPLNFLINKFWAFK